MLQPCFLDAQSIRSYYPVTMHPANRLDLDYLQEATTLGSPPSAVIDVHTHLNGPHAATVYRDAADAYGISQVCSMTHLEQVESIVEVLGDRVHFIAIPDFSHTDRLHAHGPGFLQRIRDFHAIGTRIVKFWAAPRAIDYGTEVGDPELLTLDGPTRRAAMDLAAELGMSFMTHVADPDTWFATRYSDSNTYGTKAQQYDALERMLEEYPVPWLAAHMGGSPEDLERLDGLLDRHAHLRLDTSATKWMVRELSKHEPTRLRQFLDRWRGRICFGSDIVTSDDHLEHDGQTNEMTAKASNPAEAFDLYASRYWALRHLFESTYSGPSPIADPDLAMIDPDRHGLLDAPNLQGQALPEELLIDLYTTAPQAWLDDVLGKGTPEAQDSLNLA